MHAHQQTHTWFPSCDSELQAGLHFSPMLLCKICQGQGRDQYAPRNIHATRVCSPQQNRSDACDCSYRPGSIALAVPNVFRPLILGESREPDGQDLYVLEGGVERDDNQDPERTLRDLEYSIRQGAG